MSGILQDKCIIITGGLGGIGEASARIMLREGARIVLADLDDAKGQVLSQQLSELGAQAAFVKTDVADEASVANLIEQARKRFGRIDGAFNNAAIGHKGVPLHKLSKEDFQRGLDVNLTGVFLCMKHQITSMLETGGGAIVNTGSVASVIGLPQHAEYNAAKHGIVGLMRSATSDYAALGIRVNALVVGATLTPLLRRIIPDADTNPEWAKLVSRINRFAQPEEIGEAAAWLLSDRASYVVGATIHIDGGHTAAA